MNPLAAAPRTSSWSRFPMATRSRRESRSSRSIPSRCGPTYAYRSEALKMQARTKSRSGQATLEYAILYAGVVLPLTLGIVFAAELLWVWHSVVDFTREGARYATTHCWTANGDNVLTYMRTHVPRMIDLDQ